MVLVFVIPLFVLAVTGLIRLRPDQLPANLLVLYWFPSWLAQSLAGPAIVVCAALSLLLDSRARSLAGAAALLFLFVHLRNRRDGNAIMAAVGLRTSLPLFAGFWPLSSRAGVRRISGIAYAADGERTTLDIVLPARRPTTPMPVLIHIPGGAWVVGKRNQQARPLLNHLARHGWVCLDINYRLGPSSRFPAMVTDVLRAVAWAKANVAEHGGDPAQIALTGGSAGGHLAALAALAHDGAQLKPGFEDVDCSVQAAVPVYGRYDFTDRNRLWGRNRDALIAFEATKVMPDDADERLWDLASPLTHVRRDAPPILAIHGRQDTLLPWEEAEIFVAAQRAVGGAAKLIVLSGGQHAYDMMQSAATAGHVKAIQYWISRQLRIL